MTASAGQPSHNGTHDGVEVVGEWVTGYVRRHPLASLNTVGEQFVLGVRTIEYFVVDVLTGRFQWQEFVRQSAFMAGAAVLPTILVALPVGSDAVHPVRSDGRAGRRDVLGGRGQRTRR